MYPCEYAHRMHSRSHPSIHLHIQTHVHTYTNTYIHTYTHTYGGPVWTGAENLATTGIRSPDCPARRQSLYRLSYPTHKLFVKSKNIQSTEYIGTLLKSKVNPTQMKVWISALKTLKNGQLLIESDKKCELEEFCKKIDEVCGEEPESYSQKPQNNGVLMYQKTLLLRTRHKP